MLSRTELQQALKPFKEKGLTAIKLTAKTDSLQAEFDRIASCQIGFTPIPEPSVTQYQGTESEQFDGVRESMMVSNSLPTYPQCPLTCEFYSYSWFPVEKKEPSVNEKIRELGETIPFFDALAILLEDNSELMTTEGLGSLLDECSYRSIKGGIRKPEWKYPSLDIPSVMASLAGIDKSFFARSSEFVTDETSQEVKQGFEFYNRIGGLLGGSAMADIGYYHTIRSNIQELQKQLEISSAMRSVFDCRDVEYLHIDYDSQLLMSRIDLEMAESFSAPAARHFCYLARMKSPRYLLSRVVEDEQGEEEIPTTFRQIKDFASVAKHAVLRHESHNWKPTEKPGMWASYGIGTDRRSEPDQIELTLVMSWDGDPCYGNWGEVENFRLTHPDPMRRPWLLEECSQ